MTIYVFKHLTERRPVDMHDGISAQRDLVAELQDFAIIGATQLVPVV